jgi:hypothetical protein
MSFAILMAQRIDDYWRFAFYSRDPFSPLSRRSKDRLVVSGYIFSVIGLHHLLDSDSASKERATEFLTFYKAS